MLSLCSNMQTIYYALYEGMEDIVKDGLKTGSKSKVYSDPVAFKCNVSPARGMADTEQFGISTDYDRTITTSDLNCPIEEDTILWVGVPTTQAHNYKVVRRAQSINSVLFAIKEVSKS